MRKKGPDFCLKCRVMLHTDNHHNEKPLCDFCVRGSGSDLDRSVADWIRRHCPRGGCD